MDSLMAGFALTLGYAVIVACVARVLIPVAVDWAHRAVLMLERHRLTVWADAERLEREVRS